MPQRAARPVIGDPRQWRADGRKGVAESIFQQLDEVVERGGFVHVDRPLKPYLTWSGSHVSYDRVLQQNMWRFNLRPLERAVLDQMCAEANDEGIAEVKQVALAEHFGRSQASVSNAIKSLCGHHFVWKVRRGAYQVNPTYSFAYGSTKQRAALQRIGKATMEEHEIVIPGLGGGGQ